MPEEIFDFKNFKCIYLELTAWNRTRAFFVVLSAFHSLFSENKKNAQRRIQSVRFFQRKLLKNMTYLLHNLTIFGRTKLTQTDWKINRLSSATSCCDAAAVSKLVFFYLIFNRKQEKNNFDNPGYFQRGALEARGAWGRFLRAAESTRPPSRTTILPHPLQLWACFVWPVA